MSANSFSDEKEVDLSLTDWLDGLQKTVKNSIQQHRDKESQGTAAPFGLRTNCYSFSTSVGFGDGDPGDDIDVVAVALRAI